MFDSESVTKTDNDWSLDWVNQQTKQALLCSRSESEVSLLQWHDLNWSLWWASRLVSLLQRHCQCDDLFTHIALSISESIYLVFLCQLVSLLQEQIMIDLVDWVSHSKWVCYNDNSLDSATNRLLFVSSTTYLYSQNWRTTARWYVLRTEWNIYYMSEITKI